jgi:hypothetical protein
MQKRIVFLALALIILVSSFMPANTAAAAGTYACKWAGQSPADWVTMKPRQDFDAKWTLRNTGTSSWNGADLVYLGGTAMYKYNDRYDIKKPIKPEGKATFVIDMIAPKKPGVYTTYWGLANGNKVFCRFYLIIRVK